MVERAFVERLARETEQWVADGVITAEQAAVLRARYDSPGVVAGDAAEEPRSRAANALAVIGAIAVGFGVIGFFAANWEEMSHALRLTLITLSIAAAYAGGYHLRERTARLPRVGEALYLLGVILFGSALFLVGQMFNVEAHDPLALLLWAIGAVAVAVIVRSRSIAWAALLIFTGWIGFEGGTALEDSGNDVSGLAVLSVLYGSALYALGTAALERVRADWLTETGFAEAARRLGLLIGAAGVFVFTFSEAAEGLESGELEGLLFAGMFVFAGLALAGAVALGLGDRRSGRYEAAAVVVAVAFTLLAIFAGGNGDLYALFFNLLFAAVALGAIYAGYVGEEPWLVNAGVALVAIDLIARYFDVFWSALPRSVGMIGAGVLILAIAYLLERQRKHLLARMDA
ncbi:MAG TPA: DUF2157 domain-containing protein [Gaiellaceae bacterium]|nr:DUF2157 domain-containing protein [Gaiellaceae bacterium]